MLYFFYLKKAHKYNAFSPKLQISQNKCEKDYAKFSSELSSHPFGKYSLSRILKKEKKFLENKYREMKKGKKILEKGKKCVTKHNFWRKNDSHKFLRV